VKCGVNSRSYFSPDQMKLN